ncbi:SusC/RagA family TonB-linked outer membrane protein [Pararcticibacter amylolyticus]|nr:SusC/RagA family TonB-linked outer membrane protein [Pararcticibacter amylolyticus]
MKILRQIIGGLVFLLCNATGYSVSAQIQPDSVNSDYLVPGPYLKISKERTAISSVSVSGTELSKTPVANITNTLYGQLPGLMVKQRSGEPGYDDASLSIRGRGTYDNAALIIYVDGFQVTNSYFSYLSPAEIDNITLLKDPVSLAAMGMKGANGVLWIETKRGGSGKSKVKAQILNGWQSPININKPFGSYDYARLYNEAVSNDNYRLNGNSYLWSPYYTDTQLKDYREGSGTNVDWYDEALKKNSPYTDANLVFSGGEEKGRYALILDYMKQGGIYDVPTNDTKSNAQIQRFNLRSNFDFTFFKIFEAKIDLGGRIEDRRYPNFNGPSLWENMSKYPSNIYPVKDITNNWSGTTLFPNNPVASLNGLGWLSTHDRTLQANFSLKEKLDFITPGLYLNEAVSFNTWSRNSASKTATYARFYNGSATTTDRNTDLTSNGSSPVDQYDFKQVNITAGYARDFRPHAISGALNYFISNYITDYGTNNLGQNTGNNIFYHFQNLGGRLNYTYNSRYIADFGFGWSGSDNYAPGNRRGFYPALALGWVASNESFMKENNIISYLKVRASAGTSGYDQSGSGRYLYQQYFVSNGNYYTGGSSLTANGGVIQSYAANPDIFAEKSTKYNIGFDATLFRNLSLTADVFQDKRSGIITQNNDLSAVFGGILPYSNIGKVTNKGLEVSAKFSNKTGRLVYTVGAMASYAKNRIDYQAEIPPVNDFSKTTGRAIGTPMGLIAEGFYDVADFDANGSLKSGYPAPVFGAVQPGDIRYRDLDKNNKIDQNDVTVIGNPDYPKLNYAFSLSAAYRGFDFTALLQGASDVSVNLLSAAYYQTVAFVNNINVYPIAGNAWAYYPDKGIDTRADADYPRLTTKANDNNYRNSTFWMKSGNFFRIRNVELGYSLSPATLKKLHIDKLRLYVSAANPVSWSSLHRNYHIDPETTSGYPGLKSFNTGISLTF